MKKLLILFIIGLTLIFAQTHNECINDIYFVNGVWNTEDQARNSAKKLYEVINYELIKKY